MTLLFIQEIISRYEQGLGTVMQKVARISSTLTHSGVDKLVVSDVRSMYCNNALGNGFTDGSDAAIIEAQKAIRTDPSSASAWITLSLTYRAKIILANARELDITEMVDRLCVVIGALKQCAKGTWIKWATLLQIDYAFRSYYILTQFIFRFKGVSNVDLVEQLIASEVDVDFSICCMTLLSKMHEESGNILAATELLEKCMTLSPGNTNARTVRIHSNKNYFIYTLELGNNILQSKEIP